MSKFLKLGSLLLLSSSLNAAQQERMFFDDIGRRVLVREGTAVPSDGHALPLRVELPCQNNPARICIPWSLQIPVGTVNAAAILDSVRRGFDLWNARADSPVSFIYSGTGSIEGIPYEGEIYDDHQERVVAGNFIVSFIPGEDLGESLSRSIKYVYSFPDEGRAEIRWAGVFINPNLVPDTDYRLDLLVAHEAARMIGLAPSSNVNSVLFPIQQPIAGQMRLSSDDLSRLFSVYPSSESSSQRGSLKGSVIHGDSGAGIAGAHIELIPSSSMDAFAAQRENQNDPLEFRRLSEFSAFTDSGGNFNFQAIPPGEYLILMESFSSLNAISLGRTSFDDYIFHHASNENFGSEFYDGAGRESNRELTTGFSPRMIYAAALVQVEAGAETSGVQFITGATSESSELRSASGSNRERLSSYNPDFSERTKALLESGRQLEQEPIPQQRGGGGCDLQIISDGDLGQQSGVSLISLLLLGILFLVGLRKEYCRSPSR